MALVNDEHYKHIEKWECPNCKTIYPSKRIGLTDHSFYPKYIFCEKGCARYFTIDGEDITKFVERRK